MKDLTMRTDRVSLHLRQSAEFYAYCPICSKIAEYNATLKMNGDIISSDNDYDIPANVNVDITSFKISCCGKPMKIHNTISLCRLDSTLHKLGNALITFRAKSSGLYSIMCGGQITKEKMEQLIEVLDTNGIEIESSVGGPVGEDEEEKESLPFINFNVTGGKEYSLPSEINAAISDVFNLSLRK